MQNRLRALWAERRPALNGWLAIPSGFSAECMAQCGYDTVTVDLQHGVQDYLSMVACFQAMGAHPVTPLVRVPRAEPGIVGKVLDGGAMGVICPMINSAAEAREFVRWCKYPPAGERSNGPIRAATYGDAGGAYQATANEECLAIPMIETRDAVAELDAILDTPGVAGVYVGPSDLGFSHGLPPRLDREEPEMLAIFERVVAAAEARGLSAGIHCATAPYAVRAIGMGFRLVTVMNDSGLMMQAARAATTHIRGAIA